MASARHPAYDRREASAPQPETRRSAGLGTLAYAFGLRYAFGTDHIAAIDNTTRRFLRDGKRSLGVGFFFSLGHARLDTGG
jgi:high-affinity nickel permease